MGAVTVFQQQFPGATVKSISYDAKHNPYYEVEGYYGNREVELWSNLLLLYQRFDQMLRLL